LYLRWSSCLAIKREIDLAVFNLLYNTLTSSLQINNVGFLTENTPVKPIGYLTVLYVSTGSIFSQLIASK